MKRLSYISLIFALLCTSCSSTYYLSTVKTTSSDIEQNGDGDFLIKTDSFWIAYSFNGENAPVQITVFNNSRIPLYVDWQKSALIINDEAISYVGEKINFNAQAEGSSTTYGYTYNYSISSINGEINKPSTITFIPPHSKISHMPMFLNVNFKKVPNKEYRNAHMANKDQEAVKVKRIDYTEENTPLRFRSYLTLNFEGGEPIIFEDEFYLSNLLKSAEISPSKLPKSLANRGDLFYVEKPANTTALGIVLGTAVIAGAIAVDVMIDTDDNHY